MSRLIGVAVWVAAVAALAGLWRLAEDLGKRPAPTSAPTAAAPVPRRAFLPAPFGDGWRVVHQLSAHRVLVLEVETERVQEASPIARQLAEPVKSRYAEIMIYYFRPGRRGGLPAARVEWTPRGGYDLRRYETRTSARD
jgi:hypothetical protein